jgi:THO complex subunit 3
MMMSFLQTKPKPTMLLNYLQPREVASITGHTGPVDLVRFHPSEANTLCTSAFDSSIRIWDVRGSGASQRSRIDLQARVGPGAAISVEWGSVNMLVVAERDNKVHLYDIRKLNPSFGANGGRASSAAPVHTFDLQKNEVTGCKMSPNGEFLIATTFRGEGMGELRIWPWKEGIDNPPIPEDVMTFPGHTAPIHRFMFSPDGTHLASGGSDTIVGLWDVASMVCTNTILRGTKLVRSVGFSHDSTLLASSSSDDEGVDIANADTGTLIGNVKIGKRVGAEDVAFHPKYNWLACARTEVQGMVEIGGAFPSAPPPPPHGPVVVAKLNLINA